MEHDRQSSLRPATSTQFVIFNLFGDYIMPRGGSIWTYKLLHLLELLNVSERAARSTLSRMKKEGWLVTRKSGRQTQHVLTRRGRAILEQGNQRIFETPSERWDGQWRLVVYSLPEEKRELRNQLRKKLLWYGFGNLAPGTWIAPHDWRRELEDILDDLAMRQYVTLFTVTQTGYTSNAELVQRCWNIPEIEREYQVFVDHYNTEYRTAQAQFDSAGGVDLAPEDCFVRRFWLTYDFQPFPRKDPNLPMELLPDNWIGASARNLFTNYRRLLSRGMGDFIDTIVLGQKRSYTPEDVGTLAR
ncbi:MAG: hypothetical protein MI924_03435 [Chloroflexales bacterium]|nr:hypothetical protein [Chloroflexales bacterium]